MSEPGLLSPATAAARADSLWSKAPGWRSLVMAASCLTLAAVATPLLLPQPADPGLSTQIASSNVIAAPSVRPAAPKDVIAQPVKPAPEKTASLAPAAPPISRPAPVEHPVAAPPLNTASPSAQPEVAQPAAGAPNTTAPAPDLANLPVGTQIVSSGALSRVNRHNRYSPQQGGDLPISITIISGPAHGTVTTQQGTAPLTFPNAGVSRISTVTNVFYQSQPGYTGQDSFTYKRTSSDPNDPLNAQTYTITLYVHGAAGATETKSSQPMPAPVQAAPLQATPAPQPHAAIAPAAPRSAEAATQTYCSIAVGTQAQPMGAGVVTGFEDVVTAQQRVAANQKSIGGPISPAFANTPRAIVRMDGKISGQGQIVVLPPGMTVRIGDHIAFNAIHRDAAVPCSYVPPLATADDGPARAADTLPSAGAQQP